MRKWLLIFIYLSGCHTGLHQRADENIADFNTTDASVLFFKNLRSPYYEILENKDDSVITYVLKDRHEDNDRIMLQPCINLHTYEDRASVTLKFDRDIDADYDYWIEWNAGPAGGKGKINFNHGKKDHTRTAIEIYNRLITGVDLFLHSGNEKTAILKNPDERKSFRITIVDLLRLIEAD